MRNVFVDVVRLSVHVGTAKLSDTDRYSISEVTPLFSVAGSPSNIFPFISRIAIAFQDDET